MKPRTSQSHPLRIASVEVPDGGRVGMTFCPGKRDLRAMTGPWARDLDVDLAVIRGWGASALVTLMETDELEQLRVPDLGPRARSTGLAWCHLPIRDGSIPAPSFEWAWVTEGERLRRGLRAGASVVVHCRGGLGRTGLVAARLLIELGEDPRRALRQVRAVRPGAVETAEQEAYVLRARFRTPGATSGSAGSRRQRESGGQSFGWRF